MKSAELDFSRVSAHWCAAVIFSCLTAGPKPGTDPWAWDKVFLLVLRPERFTLQEGVQNFLLCAGAICTNGVNRNNYCSPIPGCDPGNSPTPSLPNPVYDIDGKYVLLPLQFQRVPMCLTVRFKLSTVSLAIKSLASY